MAVFQVYSIPLGGMIVRQALGSGGSGSTYIYGYLDENYRTGMTRQECEEFVKTGKDIAYLPSPGVRRVGPINPVPSFSRCVGVRS